jgi:penicillin V acylase-like amidase (Ntn superfamily)
MALVRLVGLVFLISPLVSLACSSFYWKGSEGSYLGKSYDWHHDQALLLVNKRNVKKTGFTVRPWEAGPQWVSKYGSLTFNQYGREFPNGGMNEEGLTIEVLWLNASEYEGFDFRPVLNQLTWVQYQLDNFGLVTEVIEALPRFRVSPIQGKIHYFICDRTSNCAVVEWLHGKPVVHSGTDMVPKAITNSSYEASKTEFERTERLRNMLYLNASVDESSLSRFVRLATLLKMEIPSLESSFSILDSVSMANLTTWNIVYNLETREVFYRTKRNPEIRSLNLNSFDFDCSSPVLMLDIQSGRESVDQQFVPFSYQRNYEIVMDGLSDIQFSWVLAPLLNRYPQTTYCVNQ